MVQFRPGYRSTGVMSWNRYEPLHHLRQTCLGRAQQSVCQLSHQGQQLPDLYPGARPARLALYKPSDEALEKEER